MSALIDLSGKRYGRLSVIEKAGSRKVKGGTRVSWKCRCDCGVVASVDGHSLKAGHTQSCGCIGSEKTIARNSTHGLSRKHPKEYRAWKEMRGRCNRETHSDYHLYGGRGIKVADIWKNFAQFFEDMGPKPTSAHSIDRIDVNGNYEPENCRWATAKEQAQNKRSSSRLTIDGETKVVTEWARLYRIDRTKVQYRLRVGWTAKQALGIDPHERSRSAA